MKNRKLLIQIGLIVTVVFAVMMVLAHRYILKKNTEVYLEAKNEMIANDLDLFRKNIAYLLTPSIVEYFMTNTYESKQRLKDGEIDILIDLSAEDYDENFDKLDERKKRVLAQFTKYALSYEFSSCMSTRGYSDVYILVPLNDNDYFAIAFDEDDLNDSVYSVSSITDAEDATVTSAESGAEYDFGDIVTLHMEDFKEVSDISANKDSEVLFAEYTNPKNGNVYYTGYTLMLSSKGVPIGYICAEYDYSDAYTTILSSATQELIINMLIGLFIMGVLVLLMLYLTAVKPLKETKEALDLYKITKSSSDVEKRLSGFRYKNEIGQFADNVVELSQEIDRYNEENIELATKTAKVKTELDMAANIQRDSLIKVFPDSPSFEMFASMTPAKEVGGDFYDVFDMDDDHTVFVIADVSGKGMPAALFMMAAMTTIRNFSTTGSKPSEIITNVNNTLARRKVMGMFVTIWLGILDKKTGILTTSNAGHEYPAINTTGRFELYKDTHGLVAGGYAGVKYIDHEIQLAKGDTVFVYTDGVPEATNADVKMYTDVRMLEALNKAPDATPEELLRNVKSSVDEFVGEAEQFDDLTMLCFKYNG